VSSEARQLSATPPRTMSDHIISEVPPAHYKQELSRSLSLWSLLAYGLVFIVPISPFAVFGIIFNSSRGMVPLVYAVGLLAMLFTASSYMAMARAFPFAGSTYTYAARCLGATAGFIAGWSMLLDYLLLPALTYVGAAIALHSSVPAIPPFACIVVMVGAVTSINYFGIETTARASFALLSLQLLLLFLFGIFGVHALVHQVAGAHVSWSPFYNSALTPQVVFSALSLAVLSFLGFDAISTLSEESKGGAGAIAKATLLSLCLSAFFFITQTWLASLFVLGHHELPPGDATNEAFYNIAELVGGFGFKFLCAVPGVLLSGLACAATAQAATARLIYGMARDGQLPRSLGYVDPRRKVPSRAQLMVALITLVVALLLVDHLESLVSVVSVGALIGFLLLHGSVLVHFRRLGSRSWFRHLLAPVLGLAVIAYVLANASPSAMAAAAIWMTIGLALRGAGKELRR
jgi:amino acid transporter